MKYLLIRHAKTEANRLTRALFGKEGAPINDEGIEQVNALHKELLDLGVDLDTEPVVVSELLRTKQTAELAGFKNVTVNPLLNEVNTVDPKHTLALVSQGKLPEEAKVAAKAILANLPKQRVWITHGLVIAGILYELGTVDPKNLIPKLCEIIEIDI